MDLFSCILTFGLTLTAILLVIDFCLHRSRIGRRVAEIPGPRGFPIIGNLLDFAVPYDEIFLRLRKFGKEFYPTYKYWILHRPLVNIRHPDDIQIILSSPINIEKTQHSDLLRPWVKEGLLISKGKKWQDRRKMVNHAFTYNLLEEFVETFVEQTSRLLATLKVEANVQGGEVVKEVEPIFSRLSFNIICETAMGIVLDDKDREQYDYLNAIRALAGIFQFRLTRPWLANDWIFSLTKKSKEQAKALGKIHTFSKKIIEARKNYHRMNGWQFLNEPSKKTGRETDDTAINGKRRNHGKLALLDLLIATWKTSGIDDQGIQEEVDMFVAAGYDTTSTALSFATLVLAEHRDIQEKCRKEINEVLNGTPVEKITMKEVQKMKYLQQCIKEAMRLYGVTPLIGRKLSEDVQLKNHFLPRGTEVAIHLYDAHRDPHFWSEPNVFNPDRFSPEGSKGRHPYSYLPFSIGPRDCIGKKFAMLELKVVIAGLISNFYLEPVDVIGDKRFIMDFIMRCSEPMHVKLVPITK